MGDVPAVPSARSLPRGSWLLRFGSVDAVGLEAHAGELAKRSIEREARLWALELAVRAVDLTLLGASATRGKALTLCSKAVRPDPGDPSIQSVAAVCVRPSLVGVCSEQLVGTDVRVASVVTAAAQARRAVELGADEVELAIDHAALLSGHHAKVFDEIVQVREVAGAARLKVILETAEIPTYEHVRRASLLAIVAGADFVASSTVGAVPASTLPTALCIMEAIRDVHDESGRVVGFKSADGVETAEQAIQHLVLVHETLGPEWLTPDRLRLGGSHLLTDLLMEIRGERTGVYQGRDYFSVVA